MLIVERGDGQTTQVWCYPGEDGSECWYKNILRFVRAALLVDENGKMDFRTTVGHSIGDDTSDPGRHDRPGELRALWGRRGVGSVCWSLKYIIIIILY